LTIFLSCHLTSVFLSRSSFYFSLMPTIQLSDPTYQIGVFGSGSVSPEQYQMAYDVGAAIAKSGHVVISGGLTGAMEASSKGAAEAGGLVIGVMPGTDFEEGNPFSSVKILTGMRYARNAINGLSCHGAIVVSGSCGAYEEARRVWEGRGPVAVIKGSSSPTGAAETMIRLQEETGMAYPEDKPKPYKIIVANSAEEAVASVIKQIEQRYPKK
jgi:uncharacterized protein (TIGR00725 family)